MADDPDEAKMQDALADMAAARSESKMPASDGSELDPRAA